MILLSKLIEWFLPSLREKHGDRLLPSHEQALDAMGNCRTENSPVMVVECSDGRIPVFPSHIEAVMNDGCAIRFSKFQRPALK